MKIRYAINQEAVKKLKEQKEVEDRIKFEERQKFFLVYGYIFDDPETQDEQFKEGYNL